MNFERVAMDTPKKRVKPNEQHSTFEESNQHRNVKISIMSKLMRGHLGRKESGLAHPTTISEFELPLEFGKQRSKSTDSMEDELEQAEQVPNDLVLGRKLTCFQRNNIEDSLNTLNLYRSNSNVDQVRDIEDIRLGDNIYLRNINSQARKQNSAKTKNSRYDDGSRINQDYEIEKKLKWHGRHHGNYICLNKLERIFYYIKKIGISYETSDNYNFTQKLISSQIKMYNKDPKGYLLRFNQSWFEHNAIYLTFQVAAESLEDSLQSHKRIREVEVWDCLRDCSRSLKWLGGQDASHLNIKPGNILKCQGKYKLSDPYMRSEMLETYLKKQEAQWSGWQYLAPQLRKFHSLIQGLNLQQCDIYSLGMCLIESMLGQRYFPRGGKEMRVYLEKHLHGYSPLLVKTVMRMVSTNPTKRPTPEELSDFGSEEQKPTFIRRNSI